MINQKYKALYNNEVDYFLSHIPHYKKARLRNELSKYPSVPECGIINLDTSIGWSIANNQGIHWVGYYIINNNLCVYFDTFGVPPLKEFIEYLDRMNNEIKIVYNTEILQERNSVICGHLSIAFIILIHNGFSFNKTINFIKKRLKKYY